MGENPCSAAAVLELNVNMIQSKTNTLNILRTCKRFFTFNCHLISIDYVIHNRNSLGRIPTDMQVFVFDV